MGNEQQCRPSPDSPFVHDHSSSPNWPTLDQAVRRAENPLTPRKSEDALVKSQKWQWQCDWWPWYTLALVHTFGLTAEMQLIVRCPIVLWWTCHAWVKARRGDVDLDLKLFTLFTKIIIKAKAQKTNMERKQTEELCTHHKGNTEDRAEQTEGKYTQDNEN